nr:hypothetical protein [Bacteroidota bacterium]
MPVYVTSHHTIDITYPLTDEYWDPLPGQPAYYANGNEAIFPWITESWHGRKIKTLRLRKVMSEYINIITILLFML